MIFCPIDRVNQFWTTIEKVSHQVDFKRNFFNEEKLMGDTR